MVRADPRMVERLGLGAGKVQHRPDLRGVAIVCWDVGAGEDRSGIGWVVAHAWMAARGQARPPVGVGWAGGKSVAEAASSRTRWRGTPRRGAGWAGVTRC